jgi:hypothetical protein
MSPHISITPLWRARYRTLLQVTFSLVVWLEGELIMGLADTPADTSIVGLFVALASRAIGSCIPDNIRQAVNRDLPQIVELLIRGSAGCSLTTDLLRLEYVRKRLSRTVRTVLAALLMVTSPPCLAAPAIERGDQEFRCAHLADMGDLPRVCFAPATRELIATTGVVGNPLAKAG